MQLDVNINLKQAYYRVAQSLKFGTHLYKNVHVYVLSKLARNRTFADPGFFLRRGGGGGGGGPGLTARKQSGQVYFSPQLIVKFTTEGVQWFYYRENFTFPRIQRGSNFFQGGNANFYRNPYNL